MLLPGRLIRWARPQVPGKSAIAMLGTVLLLFLPFAGPGHLGAQGDTSALGRLLKTYQIKASIGLQFWGTYTRGMQVYDATTNAYAAVDDRLNTQLRRSRFTLRGQPYPTLGFQLTAAGDLVGHDVLSATEGGGNNGNTPKLALWNALVNWQLTPRREHLFLTAGYFLNPVGRESNTPAVRSTSFEKAWSQNYLRRHLMGFGGGRAMGLMLGGQVSDAAAKHHLSYQLAMQNPVFAAYAGNSTGASASPLLSGKVALHFGDPESKSYRLGHQVNYFGKRKGLTLALAAAHQSKTDAFSENAAYGLELLYNHPAFHVDGDYFLLTRHGDAGNTEAATGYLRIGKNINLPRQRVLEPVASYWIFRGPTSAEDIAVATSNGSLAGDDSGLDLGANLYFNPNLKLSLFYALRSGNAGEGNPATLANNYFQQSGAGAIQRGDYVGTGLVAIF
ncbi:hypothetical protein QWY85_03515 [Neolewinella lacunae]|uniref:Porin n=1 Tax=Neolewinella lacunae TaxID=1517758 RepID=A0A923PJL4_9BACT|nr:hypothetical protein [Neolewinella lacunae]MBC6992926.1 hypothetical protein [Neolewinella lacunae]MDN3633710.1 hypothetical protein [Neolewinella lacunae]